ncbi:MAG: Rpp14/Pop5 family protein [Candidatus Bathyarchaeia archaeon]
MRKPRRRYISVRVHGRGPCSFEMLREGLEAEFTKLFGLWGLSQAGIRLIEFDASRREAIIACWHRWLPMVRVSATLITDLQGGPVVVQVNGVSGTIRRLRRKFLSSMKPS